MLHWQLSGKHKFLAQLFCVAVVGHIIALFLIFFIYRGDLYERRLTITIPLDANIVLMPFQKSIVGNGLRAGPRAKQGSSQAEVDDPPDEKGSDNESSAPEKTIEPTSPLIGQKTILDNGALERKKRAKEHEIKRKKKLAKEKKEKALKEKKRKADEKKKALEEKKKAEQKLAEEKKKQSENSAKKKQTEDVKSAGPKKSNNEPVPANESVPSESANEQTAYGPPGEGQPFYVGQYDIETMQLAQAVAAEVAEVWRPPAGFKNKSCIVRCILDWDGAMISLTFEQSSGSPVFDISVKQAINKMKFPKELYGKEIILPFTA